VIHLFAPFGTKTDGFVEVLATFHAAERLFPRGAWGDMNAETLEFFDYGGVLLVLGQGLKR
jgi:hypothetical protein